MCFWTTLELLVVPHRTPHRPDRKTGDHTVSLISHKDPTASNCGTSATCAQGAVGIFMIYYYYFYNSGQTFVDGAARGKELIRYKTGTLLLFHTVGDYF